MASIEIQGHEERILAWMQDGAPLHCTNSAKNFLVEKFQDRVITDQSRHVHHLASSLPEFESIGFQFLKKVHQEHPETIESLIDCVKSFPEIHDSSVLG